ncbi:MAG TPA: CsbD family protein [Rubricoccaceae bacterium]|nr:CsbD family protein [Rubricoccaceae bacterium]
MADHPANQRTDGALDEAKGKVKQAWGDLTDDNSTHAEGQVDEIKGKAKQKIADVRQDVRENI